MSGIAGIIHFDGAPVAPGQIEQMTSAMAYRGPDGIKHWAKGSVALGQCMLRTTPESLEETQPLRNEDESLVLVMDGRVDNWEELRRELLGRGATLRTRADTELVLRAYEVWGESCPDRIIGEFVFFIWDFRQRRLFGARDAAGTRHFYYHSRNNRFAFASEIKGLLALDWIDPRLNESRLLDYLVPEFDRDDEVGTFYQDIYRMPAGHAMSISERGTKIWRYWEPGNLPEGHFSSMDECAEAFLAQLRIAVKCRLRSIGPVGAMLSGGLDSSAIVGLIRKEFRGELQQPLKTLSLIRDDRENCLDWKYIQEMLKDGWIDPTVITSDISSEVYRHFLDGIKNLDEPFALSHGYTNSLVFEAASKKDCRVVLDGMAGDLLFYNPDSSIRSILGKSMYAKIPTFLDAYRWHGIENGLQSGVWRIMKAAAPESLRDVYRKLRDKLGNQSENPSNMLHPETAMRFLAVKDIHRKHAKHDLTPSNDQFSHSKHFTRGALSFAHETYGQIALSQGVEPRSPFSDRRVIEFAIKMPLEAKLFAPNYKHLLRSSMVGVLPESVRWRRDIGNHPGWKFYEKLLYDIAHNAPEVWDISRITEILSQWVDAGNLDEAWKRYECKANWSIGCNLYILAVLSTWLNVKKFNFYDKGCIMNTPSKPIENTEKRIYTSPKLVSYGAVRTLTQGGLAGSSEISAGNNSSNKKA